MISLRDVLEYARLTMERQKAQKSLNLERQRLAIMVESLAVALQKLIPKLTPAQLDELKAELRKRAITLP